MFEFKLHGRASKDGEVFNTKTGKVIGSVSVACPIASGGKEPGVMFATLKGWDATGEKLGKVRKGQKIFAEGHGLTDKYEKDGKAQYTTAYWPYFVQLERDSEGEGDSGSESSSHATASSSKAKEPSDEDDVPF